uniref:MFS transporter n=1 Tax=Cyberlindnera americana TaxID=36016 RepID=A0A5P8N8P2_9ASCO|nr:MFS transporter [Cyberlindnera americana]
MSSASLEKPEETFVEVVSDHQQIDDDFSDIDESKVLRKIDIRLLPLVSLLYLLSNLDRGNIGNAYIEGLAEDLKLEGNQFNWCLTIFFLTYSACEIPSNYLLKLIGKQSVFIPTIMVLFGLTMTFMGLVKNFAGLFSLRFLLGVFEAGLYPGVSYGLTMYYAKKEMQSRQAIFYCASSVAGAFSGILAFAIAKMDGVGGYAGWRWIFILEGILTILVAVSAFFLLPDYPDTAKFLTPREQQFVIWRLQVDNNYKNVNEKIHLFEGSMRAKPDFTKFTEEDDVPLKVAFLSVFKDPAIYGHILVYWGIICPMYALSLFGPSVIYALGYTRGTAQLMTVPVYVLAAISAVIQAFIVDKVGNRSFFVLGDLLLVIIGFTMALVGQLKSINGLIYAALYIAGSGLVSLFPGIISWVAINFANPRKRAIAMACQIGLGNFGGAAAANFYKTGRYQVGHALCLGFATLAIINVIILQLGYTRANRKAKEDLRAGKYDEVTDLQLFKMGNRSPFFKYGL